MKSQANQKPKPITIVITIVALLIVFIVTAVMVFSTVKENTLTKSSADGGRVQECVMKSAGPTASRRGKTVKCQESVDLGYYRELQTSRDLRCDKPNYPVAKDCVYLDTVD